MHLNWVFLFISFLFIILAIFNYFNALMFVTLKKDNTCNLNDATKTQLIVLTIGSQVIMVSSIVCIIISLVKMFV